MQPKAQPEAEIQGLLERIAASPGFASAARRSRLLRYLVDHTLHNGAESPTEYAIGLDVFDRPTSFDPRLDSIVRTEVSRLRRSLRDYYAGPGKSESLLLDIPPRSYLATVAPREAAPNPPAPPALPPSFLAIAAVTLVIALAIAAFWLDHNRPAPVPPNSVVVLPFQNLSPDRDATQYLADGATEELTNQLAQHSDLRVVARTSAAQFKGKGVDVRDVGRALNVAAALEGSIAREGSNIRLTSQLNRTRDGYHLWSRSYIRPASEFGDVQAEVARAVWAALLQRQPSETTPPTSTTANPEAHDLYLRASYEASRQTPDSLARSLSLFQAAVDKDPSYVNAYGGIARAEIALIHITMEPPRPAFERARAALDKALSINPLDAEALGQLANIDYVYGWDWPRAEREFRQAVGQGAQATTHSYYGWALATRGRFSEAHRQFRIAQDLDPLGGGPRFNQAMAFILERRFANAKNMLTESAKNGRLDSRLILGLIGYYERNCAESSSQFEWAAKTFPSPVTDFGVGLSAACRGDTPTARLALARMTTRTRGFVSPYQLAMLHTALGDTDQAFTELQRSADAREGQIFYIKYDPIFDPIRSDPRFASMEKEVGLE
jgi:serine/threonine-protein kinase